MTAVDAPEQQYYGFWIAKGAALLDETRVLLRAWQPGQSAPDLARRAIQEDLLGRSTARRSRDIVVRCFGPRFLNPNDSPARHLQRLLDGNCPPQLFSDLVLYYASRPDRLLRDFVILSYWPAVRNGQLVVSVQQVLDFLWEAEQDGRIRNAWSQVGKPKVARSLLGALTDFGLLRDFKPGRKEVEHYSPVDDTLIYLAYLLHSIGVTDSFLAEHPTWALFGLQPADVLNRLDALSGHGWLILQRAGDVVRISWQYESLEEVVDALAG